MNNLIADIEIRKEYRKLKEDMITVQEMADKINEKDPDFLWSELLEITPGSPMGKRIAALLLGDYTVGAMLSNSIMSELEINGFEKKVNEYESQEQS